MAGNRPHEPRRRVVIEGVSPEIDGGRFPAKRVVGEHVTVEADVFADGHDALRALVLHRREDEGRWRATEMQALGNDRWRGRFRVTELGRYRYTLTAWVDRFETWRRDLDKREDPDDVALALVQGAELVEATAARATRERHGRALREWAQALRGDAPLETRRARALDPRLARLMARNPERGLATNYRRELVVVVDPLGARFSAWYEMFPRSCAPEPGRHGTFGDCEARLPYVAEMGFDVLYLPPIHPIGRVNRKGRNNALTAGPDDPGSPWAIGAAEGGHDAVHPALGTLEDFRRLLERARAHGIEVAMDIAFQCAPDHPWVEAHPSWFRWRPDGTVQFAENPPKKYEDIFPLDFECEDHEALWVELERVMRFWIEQGVTIFRVDNPHTKAFAFWERVIGAIKADHPEVVFLAEAFTRPRVLHRLAKLGFTQSYNYFPWRNTKAEITEYLTELTRGPGRQYLRPNLWPNTPDILTEYLQFGGRPAFMIRFTLAATLGASYGIYGPPFELCEAEPRKPGSEEYLDSEKYEIRQWDLDRPDSLRRYIARVNGIRRENPALQRDDTLEFHRIDNEQIICYSKRDPEADNLIVVVVNLDPHHVQSGWVELPLEDLGIDPEQPFQAHDLIGGGRYLWHGARNYVELNPAELPAHVFRLRRRVRTERDFDYFM